MRLGTMRSIRKKCPNNISQKSSRRGAATVECAFCLTIFIVITFATIDLCSAMFLKETLTLAAYEGARVGIQQGGTNENVRSVVKSFLDMRQITYAEPSVVQFSTPGCESADTLEHVSVTVNVPCGGNMPLTGAFFRGRSLTAAVTLRKEFANQ